MTSDSSPFSPKQNRSRDRSIDPRERSRERSSRYDDSHSSRHRSSRRYRSRSRSPRRHHRSDDSYRKSSVSSGSRHSRSSKYSSRSSRRYSRSPSPTYDSEDRDSRTVFVQQISARLRTKELIRFFEKAGHVLDASIVKDKASGRSKGVAYVEFKDTEAVKKAVEMTGEKLLGIPVIVQLTESEKNKADFEQGIAGNSSSESAKKGPRGHEGPVENRIYAGNIHFGVTENELRQIFESFGAIESVTLQREANGKSKGYAFIQYKDKASADIALEGMKGFMLAGRAIRVGLGSDRLNQPNTTNGPAQAFQGSAFNEQNPPIDRVGASASRNQSGAAALDDADASGVSYNKVSRETLMNKLMRDEDKLARGNSPAVHQAEPPLDSSHKASRCIVVQNFFDPSEESGDNWVQELEEDIKFKCEEDYGKVLHISIDSVSNNGEVYMKFDSVEAGEKALKGLNGRYFGGRKLVAGPIVEMVYTLKFPKSA